jgi:hypothetical protein
MAYVPTCDLANQIKNVLMSYTYIENRCATNDNFHRLNVVESQNYE